MYLANYKKVDPSTPPGQERSSGPAPASSSVAAALPPGELWVCWFARKIVQFSGLFFCCATSSVLSCCSILNRTWYMLRYCCTSLVLHLAGNIKVRLNPNTKIIRVLYSRPEWCFTVWCGVCVGSAVLLVDVSSAVSFFNTKSFMLRYA